MVVHAPFRFAPINRWVYWPPWADLVTHDIPFADGLSGQIELEIVAETPLLVGGFRRKATAEIEGEVLPFRLGTDGPYAIPGSTLQGMVRSILEVAAFGKLGNWVDDRRYGFRDLSAGMKPIYRELMIGYNKVQSGFLTIVGDSWTITPTERRKIKFAAIDAHADAQWTVDSTIAQRYGWTSSVGPFKALGAPKVTSLKADPTGDSWLVVTGNVKDSAKLHEFVFVERRGTTPLTVDPAVVEEFKALHEDYSNEDPNRWNPGWHYFWFTGYGSSGPAKSGGRFPVFYIMDKSKKVVTGVGLSGMFRLMHAKSPRELLSNSSADHSDETRYDLPTLIFGAAVNEFGDVGLKRRAAFDLARPKTAPSGKHIEIKLGEPIKSAMLLSPKPTFYPTYVRQPVSTTPGRLPVAHRGVDKKGRPTTEYVPYATYTPLTKAMYGEHGDNKAPLITQEHKEPELAGVKIWPAGTGVPRRARAPYLDKDETRAVSTTLRPLAAGSAFTTTLRFHNLRPIELGAVLWALSFGLTETNLSKPRHRLGMGKPLGLGEVTITIANLSATTLSGAPSNDPTAHFVKAFVDEMSVNYAERARFTTDAANANWVKSAQVSALLKAAIPSADTQFVCTKRISPWRVNTYDYMELNPAQGGWDDFADAKEGGWFLPSYVLGAHEFPKGPRIIPPHKGARVRLSNDREGMITEEQLPDGRWLVHFDAGEFLKCREQAFAVISAAAILS